MLPLPQGCFCLNCGLQAGWYYYGYENSEDSGGDYCLGGYVHVDDGKPRVVSKKQIKMDCGRENEDWVRFWEIL